MKKIFLLMGVLYLFSSCSDTSQVSVTYTASGSVSAYDLEYIDQSGELISIKVNPESAQDSWSVSYFADKGDIVYLSGYYKNVNSSLDLMILLDGKTHKQATSVGDTLSYLTLSGTIPY